MKSMPEQQKSQRKKNKFATVVVVVGRFPSLPCTHHGRRNSGPACPRQFWSIGPGWGFRIWPHGFWILDLVWCNEKNHLQARGIKDPPPQMNILCSQIFASRSPLQDTQHRSSEGGGVLRCFGRDYTEIEK